MVENSRINRRTVIIALCCQAWVTAAIVFVLLRQSTLTPAPSPELKAAEGPTSSQQTALKTMQYSLADVERMAKAAEARLPFRPNAPQDAEEGPPLGANDVPDEIERGMRMDAVMRQTPLLDRRGAVITTTPEFILTPNVLKK